VVLIAALVLALPQAAAAGTISGKVTGAGGESTMGGIVSVLSGERLVASAGIQEDGTYETRDLPAGSYLVRFEPKRGVVPPLGHGLVPQWNGGVYFAEDSTPVGVPAKGTVAADVTLPLEAILTGRLTFPNGSPAKAYPLVFDGQGRGIFGCCAVQNYSNGDYTFRGLPAGTIKVAFSSAGVFDTTQLVAHAPFFVEREWWKNRYSVDTAQPITVRAGATTSGIDATLTRAGTIQGTLTSQAGYGLKDARIYATRSDGRRAGPFPSDWHGRYIAYGLRPGSWTLKVVPPFSGHLITVIGPVDVSYGIRATRNATIPLAARIEGTVTGPGGQPLAEVRVRAYNAAGAVVSEVQTRADGTYSLGRLSTGSYRVSFGHPFGTDLGDEFYDDQPTLEQATPVSATAGSTTSGIDAELSSAP
jgi:hypothetical protein